MVLMHAVRDLILPDPAPTKLIPITSFIKEHVSSAKTQALGGSGRHPDRGYYRQIKVASLYVRNAQIRYFNESHKFVLFYCL